MGQKTETGDTIKSVQTAVRVLELLKKHDGLRVSELAEELDSTNSTAYRYLNTLTNEEYITKEGHTYKVGLQFLSFGEYVRLQRSEYQMVKEKVDQLVQETGERGNYLVPEHGKGVWLYQTRSEQAVQTNSEIGDRIPLHVTASGKAILATWSIKKVKQYINSNLESYTSNTITDPDKLIDELKTIRRQGYSTSYQEYFKELNAVSIAISQPSGKVLGAIGVAGPTHRMNGTYLEEELPKLLLTIGQEIEVNIKYSGL